MKIDKTVAEIIVLHRPSANGIAFNNNFTLLQLFGASSIFGNDGNSNSRRVSLIG